MPWRDEIQIDAVSYSDIPKEDGPAPVIDERTTGKVLELRLTDGEDVFDSQFQFWVSRDDSIEKAPYIAWQIEEQSGVYGVFDGHGKKIWLGEAEYVVHNSSFSHVELTEDWRDKIHWEDMVDRVWMAKRQYSYEQVAPLTEIESRDLVSDCFKSSVYRLDTESYRSDEGELQLQLWRPKTCQTVFVATRLEMSDTDTVLEGKKGVIDKAGIIPDGPGDAFGLEKDALSTISDLAMDLRSDGIRGLTIE